MGRRFVFAVFAMAVVLTPNVAQAAVPPVSLEGPAGYISRGKNATCPSDRIPYSEGGIVADQYGRGWYYGVSGCVRPTPKQGLGQRGVLYAVLRSAANPNDTFTGTSRALVYACSIGGCGWSHTFTWTTGTGAYAGARGT